ncbi:hypothetical protein [Tellurirhabdus bombi]|uniref:hypothetical protein n=1 Tax=Tellurirhabdus bombi TaxID=2907205 RepID=UPI001F3DA5AC|nr:hypothetical protein [Tellurirhabdus bombi]
MGVTILEQPDQFALTKGGRTSYVFSGNARTLLVGTKAVSSVGFGGPVADGDIVHLFWKGRSLQLIARDTPTEPHEFPTGNGDPTYITGILPYFRDYYPIEEDFIVHDAGFQLIFTARQPGPTYNLAPRTQGTIVVANPTAGVDPVKRERYSVYVQVYCQKIGSSDFKRIWDGPLEFDDQDQTRIDLSGTLHSELEADLPYWNAVQPKLCTASARAYYIRYGEAWGEPANIGRLTQHTTKYAYWGGLPYELKGKVQLIDLIRPSADAPEQDRALRLGPSTRYVRVDEPQYLSFLALRGEITFSFLEVTMTFDDDSTRTRIDLLPGLSIPAYAKAVFPTGVDELGLRLNTPQGRLLKEYTVQLKNAFGYWSKKYRYIVDYRQQPYVRYLAYVNSFGAIDTVKTHGKGSLELDVFHDQAEQYLPANYELSDGQFVEYNTAVQQRLEVATGWQNEPVLRLFHDFYRSRQRWHLLPNRQFPIGLLSKSIKQKKDGDTTFAHKFEIVYLFQDEFLHQGELTDGDVLPPPGTQVAGNVSVQPAETVFARDNTVPEVARTLTPGDVNNWNQAFGWGNHSLAGYLTQQTASTLFATKGHAHSFNDLTHKPGLDGIAALGAETGRKLGMAGLIIFKRKTNG